MKLEKLLYFQGIGNRFIDCYGQEVEIPYHDREGVLQCMLAGEDFSVSSEWCIDERVHLLDAKPWTRALHAFQHTNDHEPYVSVYLKSDYSNQINLLINTECGEHATGAVYPKDLHIVGDYRIHDTLYLHYQVALKQLFPNFELGLGYHTVALSLADPLVTLTGILLVSPAKTYQFNDIKQNRVKNGTDSDSDTNAKRLAQPWGISVQLYSLRSDEQWGIGDFGDLRYLITMIAEQGGDFIQLNPLHALDNFNHTSISPYSPSDRRRVNPLYIEISGVDEYRYIEPQVATQTFVDKKIDLNRDNWLDYDSVIIVKYQLLNMLYDAFCTYELADNSSRAQAFLLFVDSQGDDLNYFATELAAKAPAGFYADPHFYCYLQFLAESQLEECQLNAKALGMSIGLIRDLAVGASPDGIEVKQNQHQFCLNASIGAPPDPFAPQGQNWGLTPLDPIKLKQHNFGHFIHILRSNMKACGALRIDHVMSMLRLWWWPNIANLGNGAYVYYPVETLLAILCLESQRAKCCIIGEDLGVVPPELHGYLTQAGIYSNQLFYFCKHANGFYEPDEHKAHSLMMLANHDVPTLAAWWSSSDLHIKRQIELFDNDEALGDALNQREHEKYQLLKLLIHHSLLSEIEDINSIEYEQVLHAWVALAAKSSSGLFSIQLCDLIGERHSVNIPGTWQEYANWQRRLPLTLKAIEDSPQVQMLLREIYSARNGSEIDALTL